MIDVEQLRGGLVVSCQAYPGEPLRDHDVTARTARAVVEGGARAVRVQGMSDVRATVAAVDVPVIGLWKDGDGGVFITPTLQHAAAVAEAGAHVVALVLSSASCADDRSGFEQALDDDADLVVSDTNRRRAQSWGSIRDTTGRTERAGEARNEDDVNEYLRKSFYNAG